MDLTQSSDASDISARLDRIERSMGKLVDVISQSTLVARADTLSGPTPSLGAGDDQLSAALVEISEPDVLAALRRIASLAPQLQAAAQVAGAAPELLKEALNVARERMGDDGTQRMQALGETLAQLTQPEVTRALAQLGAAAPALAGPLTAASQAIGEVRSARGARELDDNLRELTRTVLDPQVTQALTRIAGLLPQLEYAAFGAAAVPELLEEALEVVRDKTADLRDGVPLEQRLRVLAQTGLRLTQPEFVKRATDVLVHALPIVDKLCAVDAKTVEQSLKLLELATSQELRGPLTKLLSSMPALSEALSALSTDRATLAWLKEASSSVGDVVKQGAAPVGMFGAFRSLGDPSVQKAMGFAVAVARELGAKLGDSPKQLTSDTP